MKRWIIVLILSLVACSTPPTQLPLSTETPIPSPTPQIIEVTRVVKVEQTVVVTATPEPLLAQECVDTAHNQLELNSCAILEREFAKEELEKTISRIEFSQEDKQTFDKLQVEWQKQVEKECEFFYGQLYADDNGNFYYKWGSMAPMQWAFCEAERYKQRIEELKFAYLSP